MSLVEPSFRCQLTQTNQELDLRSSKFELLWLYFIGLHQLCQVERGFNSFKYKWLSGESSWYHYSTASDSQWVLISCSLFLELHLALHEILSQRFNSLEYLLGNGSSTVEEQIPRYQEIKGSNPAREGAGAEDRATIYRMQKWWKLRADIKRFISACISDGHRGWVSSWNIWHGSSIGSPFLVLLISGHCRKMHSRNPFSTTKMGSSTHGIWTRGRWVRRANATSVLCAPPPPPGPSLYWCPFNMKGSVRKNHENENCVCLTCFEILSRKLKADGDIMSDDETSRQ